MVWVWCRNPDISPPNSSEINFKVMLSSWFWSTSGRYGRSKLISTTTNSTATKNTKRKMNFLRCKLKARWSNSICTIMARMKLYNQKYKTGRDSWWNLRSINLCRRYQKNNWMKSLHKKNWHYLFIARNEGICR